MHHVPSHSKSPDSAQSPVPSARQRNQIKLGPIQAISGLVFALFLTLHLATAASGILGSAGYDATLTALRRVYRPNLALELTLIGGSALVHIACAIAQMRRRGRIVALTGPLWMRAHRASGYFLLLVLIWHVLATRVGPTLATGPTATGQADFAFLAFATLTAPAFFWPYYLMFGIAGSLHLGLGLHLASRMLRRRGVDAGSDHSPSDKVPARPPQGAPDTTRRVAILLFTGVVTAGVFSILWHASDAPRERFPEYKALADRLLR